ncbi:MAG: sulfurtransferase complex subunit TusB [Methanosarcina sp.]|jgi:tRNA 2-thiouridine synthesizing protein B|nr:sulfurtransferase complex subunit TusB [Methanosarcina sp.]
MKQEKLDVFLLTKPPFSPRSELCLKLAARSGKARIYLAGDGVYNLLTGIEKVPECDVYACKEDLEARAIMAGEKVTVPDDFYSDFIEDIMEHCRHEYTF